MRFSMVSSDLQRASGNYFVGEKVGSSIE